MHHYTRGTAHALKIENDETQPPVVRHMPFSHEFVNLSVLLPL